MLDTGEDDHEPLERFTPLPNERDKLLEIMPALGKVAVCYAGSTHVIIVIFRTGRELVFPVREWMTDECLARIGLMAP